MIYRTYSNTAQGLIRSGKHQDNWEVRFFDWLERPVVKYNKDGTVRRRLNKDRGNFYRKTCIEPTTKKMGRAILLFLALMIGGLYMLVLF